MSDKESFQNSANMISYQVSQFHLSFLQAED